MPNLITSLISMMNTEITQLKTAHSPWKPLSEGLYAFNVLTAGDREKRIHLRVEANGAGKLFIDVTDVIHLNHTGAEIAFLGLNKVPKKEAISILRNKFKGNMQKISDDVDRLYLVIDHFLSNPDGCQTCALTGLLATAPLFSLEANAPYKIDVALTYGCNNQCPHCYNESSRLHMPSLPLNKWKAVFDKIVEIGTPHVILTGGEATLHPDFLEIIHYADQLGLVVGLNSNGRYLANKNFSHRVKKAGLNHVQITLGSCDQEVHDEMMGTRSFHQTIKGIKTSLKVGLHVITNTTLIQSNIDHVEEIIDFIYQIGIRTFAMNGMIYSGGGFENPEAIHEDELLPLLASIKAYADLKGMRFLWYTPTEYCRFSPFEIDLGVKRCNAGEYSICIEPNGDVLPCQSYYVSAGNILEESWDDIWEGELFKSFRMRTEDPQGSEMPEKCWDCPEFSVCGGGCRIEREAQQGKRIAELAGGGCIGCTGFSSEQNSKMRNRTRINEYNAEKGAFIPFESMLQRDKRSTGTVQFSATRSKSKD